MLNLNPHLSEVYFVSSFMSGLSEEVRPMVKMLQLGTMEQATKSARLQELMVEAIMKKQRQKLRGVLINNPNKGYGKEMMNQGSTGVMIPTPSNPTTMQGGKMIE